LQKNDAIMQKRTIDDLQRINVESFKNQEKIPLVVILDNVRSALNVGSAFRTADAFALESVILCGITAQPPHREILKTALGADQSVDWRYFDDTCDAIKHFQNQGYQVWAVEQVKDSTWLQDFIWPEVPLCIVFGNEVDGVSDEVMELVNGCIEIPQFGTKHSLNISVSMGIVIWELFKKKKL
jgi:tRNA G18 (ribose-2'-O)-methylase SpoU